MLRKGKNCPNTFLCLFIKYVLIGFFFKTKLRYLKLKEWLQELAISIEIVSVALNVTKNWILRLVVKVGIFQNTFYIHSNKGQIEH